MSEHSVKLAGHLVGQYPMKDFYFQQWRVKIKYNVNAPETESRRHGAITLRWRKESCAELKFLEQKEVRPLVEV